MANTVLRCDWAEHSQLERHYHDTQWGIPVHDDRELFKMLILEGQQAGLSWLTILKKMDALCLAYDNFDPALLARYDEVKVAELLSNEGIIRNRAKVAAAVQNAQSYEVLCQKHGSLDTFLWGYVDFQPVENQWEHISQVPCRTPLSDAISKDLQKFGFKFAGTIIVYSLLQSVGIVNDHLLQCSFRDPQRRQEGRWQEG